MGSFGNWQSPLSQFATAYAEPVNRRIALVKDAAAFAEAYLDGFHRQFLQIQEHYRTFRRAFDALFAHYVPDSESNIRHAWIEVLARLDSTNVRALVARIREQIHLP